MVVTKLVTTAWRQRSDARHPSDLGTQEGLLSEVTLAVQATSALKKACGLAVERLETLSQRVETGDVDLWPDLLATATAVAALLPVLAPGSQGEFITTEQMAQRLGISPKTLLKKKDKIRPALRLGARGRGAIRWRGDEAS
jgi:hypothetical protein